MRIAESEAHTFLDAHCIFLRPQVGFFHGFLEAWTLCSWTSRTTSGKVMLTALLTHSGAFVF